MDNTIEKRTAIVDKISGHIPTILGHVDPMSGQIQTNKETVLAGWKYPGLTMEFLGLAAL